MRELNRIPLSGLRAIEAVGRLGTLSRAAEELGVTVGAVSQRLAKAEAALGRTLFARTGAGLVPTPIGAEIVPRLTRGMADLAAAVRLADPGREDRLVVSVAPLFASRWLIWRIQRFNRRHPAVRVRIEPTAQLTSPDETDVDVCIRFGRGGWADGDAERLLEQRVFPVCSADTARLLRHPSDLAAVPIIRESEALVGWDAWLAHHDLAPDILGEGPTYADGSLCLDAAMTGQGVFLAWETLACDALEAGRLVAPFPARVASGGHYWVVTGSRSGRSPPVRQFVAWLREELDGSVRAWRATETGRPAAPAWGEPDAPTRPGNA